MPITPKQKSKRQRQSADAGGNMPVTPDAGGTMPTSKRRRKNPLSDEEKARRQALAVEYTSRSTSTPTADEGWHKYTQRRLIALAKEVPDLKSCHMHICSLEYKKKPSSEASAPQMTASEGSAPE